MKVDGKHGLREVEWERSVPLMAGLPPWLLAFLARTLRFHMSTHFITLCTALCTRVLP